jgi:hypothetical protein
METRKDPSKGFDARTILCARSNSNHLRIEKNPARALPGKRPRGLFAGEPACVRVLECVSQSNIMLRVDS